MGAVPYAIDTIAAALHAGRLIPYLGPATLDTDGSAKVPTTNEGLASQLRIGQPVPTRIRRNVTAVAQYIENFRHRKILRNKMQQVFQTQTPATPLHYFIARLNNVPLIVDVWYDDAIFFALGGRCDWGQIQGVSRAEHRDHWFRYFNAAGIPATVEDATQWRTIVYKPIGCIYPAGNFLVSDSDYVEVLTEIDIQTPIPPEVQKLRTDRGFLFLGCRFMTQLERTYARQMMKRSAGPHWMVFDGTPTRNEARFLAEQKIQTIRLSCGDFMRQMPGFATA